MIFYFSGTGNSRWVATQLSNITHEKLVNIADFMCDVTFSQTLQAKSFILEKDERLGFVFPVHGWRVPRLIRKFISEMLCVEVPDSIHPFTYCVCTAGDDIGLTIDYLNNVLKANSYLHQIGIQQVDSAYSLILPESYVGLPFMDVDTKENEQKKKSQAAIDLQGIAEEIYDRKAGIQRIHPGGTPWVKSKIIGEVFERFLITDKRFHVTTEKCVRCGICANVCPVKDIEGGHGKMPQWKHHDNCLTCFTCYHHCPQHAIEFGRQTQRKGQYYFK